ncbi:MAG: hypothetical protein ACC628_08350 [Pirellulaceae bacterium]
MAVGITLAIVGGECLIVEKAVFVLPAGKKPPPQAASFPGISYLPGSEYLIGSKPPPTQSKHEVKLPDWAPYALLSAGAIVAIYSVTLAKSGR